MKREEIRVGQRVSFSGPPRRTNGVILSVGLDYAGVEWHDGLNEVVGNYLVDALIPESTPEPRQPQVGDTVRVKGRSTLGFVQHVTADHVAEVRWSDGHDGYWAASDLEIVTPAPAPAPNPIDILILRTPQERIEFLRDFARLWCVQCGKPVQCRCGSLPGVPVSLMQGLGM